QPPSAWRHPVKMKAQLRASPGGGQAAPRRRGGDSSLTTARRLFSLGGLNPPPRAKDQCMFRPIYLAVVLAGLSGPVLAQSDLMTIYQEALLNSADLAAAEADALARHEVLPQARSQLLPSIGLGAGVAREYVDAD